MSTWISRAAALAASLTLLGCDEGFNVTRAAPEAIRLPDGLVVAGARGWCVDRSATRPAGEASVIVLGSCAAISRNVRRPEPPVRGVFTVSIEDTPTGELSPKILETFLRSTAGRAALARNGKPSSLEILEIRTEDDALILHAVDRSGWPQTAADDYWRALFDIDGRFVTVSLVGLAEQPIPPRDGLAAIEAQVDRLIAANTR